MVFNNPDLYPTPLSLMEKVLEPYKEKVWRGGINGYYTEGYGKLSEMTILEPSAGTGNFCDFLTGEFIIKKDNWKNHGGSDSEYNITSAESIRKSQLYCIERDPECRHILNSKGYRVIHSNFLTYVPEINFDLIIMNPPFSCGDQHLLKAWDVIENGDIICLLNAETIKNPYTERRQLLSKIIADNQGTVEFLENEFLDAERTTAVEVALVRLTKKSKESRFKFDFKNVADEKGFNLTEDNIKNLPETLDVIGNMILQFEKLKETFVEYIKVEKALAYYAEPITTFSNNPDYRGIVDLVAKTKGSPQTRFNEFMDVVRNDMWQIVIDKLGMERYMTRAVKSNFKSFRSAQGQMQFTKENITEIIQMLLMNGAQILEDAIVEVFDALTAHHEYNRCHVEGWKTNSAWKVNRKLIFPYGCGFDQKWFNQGYQTQFTLHNYYSDSSYADLDKVLVYISGETFEEITTIQDALHDKFKKLGHLTKGHDKIDNTCESTFFKIKFWKKGTVHLEFKDEFLWTEFNLRACANKKWLPWKEEKAWKESKGESTEPVYESTTPILQIEAPINLIPDDSMDVELSLWGS